MYFAYSLYNASLRNPSGLFHLSFYTIVQQLDNCLVVTTLQLLGSYYQFMRLDYLFVYLFPLFHKGLRFTLIIVIYLILNNSSLRPVTTVP